MTGTHTCGGISRPDYRWQTVGVISHSLSSRMVVHSGHIDSFFHSLLLFSPSDYNDLDVQEPSQTQTELTFNSRKPLVCLLLYHIKVLSTSSSCLTYLSGRLSVYKGGSHLIRLKGNHFRHSITDETMWL